WADQPDVLRAPQSHPLAQSAPLTPPAGPVRPAGYTVPAAADPVVPFDAATVEGRFVDGRWGWTHGGRARRDFGRYQAEAGAALQMARGLRPTPYGVLGSPQPVLEYWLTDGRAPEGILSQRTVVPFEPDRLRVEQLNGVWVLRDPVQ